jgi:hypothetical protein
MYEQRVVDLSTLVCNAIVASGTQISNVPCRADEVAIQNVPCRADEVAIRNIPCRADQVH